MTGFCLAASIGMKEITPEQATWWAFGNFFVPFGLPKMIFVDANGIFAGMFKKTFQGTLLISIHTVARGKYKAIRNEGFHRYLNKVQKINSADKVILHQWLHGVLFALYAWNAGPVDWTDITYSVVSIDREFPYPIDLSPQSSMDVNHKDNKPWITLRMHPHLWLKKYSCLTSWYLKGGWGTGRHSIKASSWENLTQETS